MQFNNTIESGSIFVFCFFSFNFLWCCWGNEGINSLLRNWNWCLPCFGYQRVQTCNLTISSHNKKEGNKKVPKNPESWEYWLRSTIALRQNKKKWFWATTLQFSVTCQQTTWRLRSEIKTRERERSQEVKSKKMFGNSSKNHHVKSQISFKILEFRVSTTESFSAESYLAF